MPFNFLEKMATGSLLFEIAMAKKARKGKQKGKR